MERVQTLCDLLQQKLAAQRPTNELIHTVRMIESELLHLQNGAAGKDASGSAIFIAKHFDLREKEEKEIPQGEEKTVEMLQIDEADIEAELEEIKKNAEEKNKISIQNKPPVHFDPVEDIPTLANRSGNISAPKEIHELIPVNNAASLNERLRQEQNEVSDLLKEAPVKDLKKAIGVNDRYLFINELFRGDEAMYERSIKTINGFGIFPEAEYWIRRELKLKLGWDDKAETVQQFDQLVRRRFA